MAAHKKTIGIIGGIGPEATVDTFRWIVNLTPAKSDHDHIPVLIFNNPQVPSRADAILNNGISPVPILIDMAQSLEKMGADFLIMPCNTAHYYIEKIQEKIKIPIINMIDETTQYVLSCEHLKEGIGLLATEMTLRTGIYQESLIGKKVESITHEVPEKLIREIGKLTKRRYTAEMGINPFENDPELVTSIAAEKEDFTILAPSKELQDKTVSKAIFGKHGIKAGEYDEPNKLLKEAIEVLKRKGAKHAIMGCTEIPLAVRQEDVKDIELINPTKILAQTAVDIALGKKPLPKIK